MGLNRYDGYDVSVFRYFDVERTLPAANIHSLREDAAGNIWIRYDNGMVRYDMRSQTFHADNRQYLKSLGLNVSAESAMTVDGWGNLWFAGDGKVCYHNCKTGENRQWKVKLSMKGSQWHIVDCA